jgi:hypothetical protein
VIPEGGFLNVVINERMLDEGGHRPAFVSIVRTIRR